MSNGQSAPEPNSPSESGFGPGQSPDTSAMPRVEREPATAAHPVVTPTAGGQQQSAQQQYPQQPYAQQAYPAAAPAAEKKKRTFGLPALVATALIASLIGGGIAGGIASSTAKNTGESSSSPSAITITNGEGATAANAVAAKATPSVVTIGAIKGQSGGLGSGIVLDKEGHILTNAHVVTVDGSTSGVELQVRTADNKVYTGRLVGADPLSDLAVLKIDAPNLVPASLGDSAAVNVGDMATVIGSPLGLSGTVTSGIISTKSRTISLTNSQTTSTRTADPVYVNVIQTDAALNHGNSGGALVNGKGEVIGVNVAIYSTSSADSEGGNSGLGFAIPINAAKRVADSLIKDGTASHGYLGVQVGSQKPEGISGQSMFSAGAVIGNVVPDSPADKAGLKKGDVITSVDGMMIEDAKSLTAAVRTFPSGQKATFKVQRDGKETDVTVTLGDIPSK